MGENLINDINKLKYLYNNSRSEKQKSYILYDIEWLRKCLFDFFYINYEDYLTVNYNSIYNYLTKKDFINADNYEKYIELNNDVANKFIDVLKNNNYYPYTFYGNLNYPNNNEYNELIKEFFSSLGNNVLDLFLKMASEKRIYAGNLNNNCSGYCYPNLINDSSIIYLNNPQNQHQFLTLAHEMGHIWEFDILKKRSIYPSRSILQEVVSTTFENMFIEYILNNYIKDDGYKLMNSGLYGVLYMAIQIDALYQSYTKNKFKIEDNIIINMDFVDEIEIYSSIYKTLKKDNYYLEQNNSILVDPEMSMYVNAEIISNHLIAKMDNKTIMEYLKDFILNYNDLNYESTIEKYDLYNDFDSTDEKIKKVMKYNKGKFGF